MHQLNFKIRTFKQTYMICPHTEGIYNHNIFIINCETILQAIQYFKSVGGFVDLHDDVIKWKHFPRNWPFVRGLHRSPVNSPHKGQWRGALMFFFYLHRNKQLSKQSRGWWFETPSGSLWRQCNVWALYRHLITEERRAVNWSIE